ncbi:hypothetical protein [Exiguobacterium aestuarii]|uniref:hypothetical protein n=1 Tax=Exiguobacterium aestuarii TaxID=273527 RepID=UPI001CD389EA|nr:hypothetical protein [Exiguobacterium aestuarii]MCA0980255.1 hypothetical protein [Exiguobacterium aestuarii]
MIDLILGTNNTLLNVDNVTAFLTAVTVCLSTWAAFSAKASADAAQSQFNLSKEDSKMSKQPLLIPIESDYQAASPRINETLEGNETIGTKFGDLKIELTNVANSNAFNVVSYLDVRNLENYLDFVSKNDLSDIWLESYSISKRGKKSPKNISYYEIMLRNHNKSSQVEYNYSYIARNRANPKMTIGSNGYMDVTVNSYAQLILRDYINRKIALIFDPETPLEDPELVIVTRFKTVEQLRLNEYTVSTYKVVLHQISSSADEGISFRLMYEYESDKVIEG